MVVKRRSCSLRQLLVDEVVKLPSQVSLRQKKFWRTNRQCKGRIMENWGPQLFYSENDTLLCGFTGQTASRTTWTALVGVGGLASVLVGRSIGQC